MAEIKNQYLVKFLTKYKNLINLNKFAELYCKLSSDDEFKYKILMSELTQLLHASGFNVLDVELPNNELFHNHYFAYRLQFNEYVCTEKNSASKKFTSCTFKKLDVSSLSHKDMYCRFSDCYAESLILPQLPKVIARFPILTNNFIVPPEVTHLLDRVFAGYKNIDSIYIPKSVKHIGKNAFSRTSVSEIVIDGDIEYLSASTFYDCNKLTKLVLPDTLDQIDDAVFSGCNKLTNINFNGTMDQWHNIDLFTDRKGKALWAEGSSIKTIICKDGVINVNQ